MIKKSVYPKTQRIGVADRHFTITEKLDGSNLCIFKKDGRLFFAQRNNIMEEHDLIEQPKAFYKGLVGWINENIHQLKTIAEGAVLCGEWIGMGKINYNVESEVKIDKRFYMFAKANLEDDGFTLKNIIYKQDLFIYPFTDRVIPDCIGLVPVVLDNIKEVNIAMLDELYDEYKNTIGRNTEGFVVYDGVTNRIAKYVRMKNGQESEFLTSHAKPNVKYYEFSDPYYALICAKNPTDAKEKYVELVADDDVEMKEVSIDHAIKNVKQVDQELATQMRGNHINESRVLLIDRKLV